MLGYRRNSFLRAHKLLFELSENLDDLDKLRKLQQILLEEIFIGEEKIRSYKKQLKEVAASAHELAIIRRSRFIDGRIEGHRKANYVWRCFGDAIAFLYLDKFAIKQTYFNTGNIKPKQDAGFIAGKEGLGSEISMLESALQHGVPALLVDLTNTIRHGDLCLLGGSDPHLIEVKSGKKLDSRAKRQAQDIRLLHSFFEKDIVQGLRGLPEMRRRGSSIPERTYIDELNCCLADAYRDGYSVWSPRRGLHYIAIADDKAKLDEIMTAINPKRSWPFFLNEFKSARAWSPYTPFVLSIKDSRHLYDFIRGHLFIFVMMETDELCAIASDMGYDAIFDFDDLDYPLKIQIPEMDGPARIAAQFLARIGMEFVSPEWLIKVSVQNFQKVTKEATEASPA